MKVDINLYIAYRALVEADLENLIIELNEPSIRDYFYKNYEKEIHDNIFLHMNIDIYEIFVHYKNFILELIRRKDKRGIAYLI